MPVTGGLSRGALRYAMSIGAEAIQIFVSSPRSWAMAIPDRRDDHAFREGCSAARLPVFVHAPYLVNLGSATAATRDRSRDVLARTLDRAAELGAQGVVVHTGSAITATRRDAALRQVRDLLLPLLDGLAPGAPALLLEPTAGGGQSLAARVEDLGDYLAVLDGHPHVGICLDTCHAFAAGHDLAAPGGVRTVLNALVRTVGRGRLRLVHANDSRDPVGSRRDRHAAIGAGSLGADSFQELFVHPATRGVPLVVETPGGAAGQRKDIALLKTMRAG